MSYVGMIVTSGKKDRQPKESKTAEVDRSSLQKLDSADHVSPAPPVCSLLEFCAFSNIHVFMYFPAALTHVLVLPGLLGLEQRVEDFSGRLNAGEHVVPGGAREEDSISNLFFFLFFPAAFQESPSRAKVAPSLV